MTDPLFWAVCILGVAIFVALLKIGVYLRTTIELSKLPEVRTSGQEVRKQETEQTANPEFSGHRELDPPLPTAKPYPRHSEKRAPKMMDDERAYLIEQKQIEARSPIRL